MPRERRLAQAALAVATAIFIGYSASSVSADPGDPAAPPSVFSVEIDDLFAGSSATLSFGSAGATSTSCQWQLNNSGSNGPTGSWSDISGATSCSSYTPVSGNGGKWHRAAVTVTNDAGSDTAYSRPFRLGGEVIGDESCAMKKALADGSRVSLSAGPSPPPCPTSPDVSPNGKLVVYTSSSSGQADIWLTDSRGAWKRQLTSGSADDSTPKFSPDGTKIGFLRKDGTTISVYYIDLVSGSVVQVASASSTGSEPIRFSQFNIAWAGNETLYYVKRGLSTGLPGGSPWRYWYQKNLITGQETFGKSVDTPTCPGGGEQWPYYKACYFVTEIWMGGEQLTETPAATSVAEFNQTSQLLETTRGLGAATRRTLPRVDWADQRGSVGGAAKVGASALEDASAAAFKAADNIDAFTLSAKHLPGAGGTWTKFGSGVDPRAAIEEALRSKGAMFRPNPGTSDRFRVVTDLGRVVGSRGETAVRVVVSNDGRVITAFPVRG